MQSHQMFINGAFVDAIGGATMPVVDPGTGEAFAQVPCGDERDVNAAVAAARAPSTAACGATWRPPCAPRR